MKIHNHQTTGLVFFRLICLGNSTCTDCTDVYLPIISGAKGTQPKDKIRFVYINVYILCPRGGAPEVTHSGGPSSGAALDKGAEGQLVGGWTDGAGADGS